MTVWSTAAAIVGGCALAGCSLAGSPTPRPSPVAEAQARHEYPAPRPAPESAVDPQPSAVAAIRAFANAYINWDALSVSSSMRALAAHSVGQARSAAELAAAETANDYELRQGGIANSGTVEAISPLVGHPLQYLVVSRERTTATGTDAYQGLRPAWHVTVATVVELGQAGWAVSGWQPQS